MIELVMVVAILGIIGLAGTDFISRAFLGYSQTLAQLELYEEGKLALVRLERELHNMVPNAICVTNDQGASCETDGTPGNEIRFGLISEDRMRALNLRGTYSEGVIEFPMAASRPPTLTDGNGTATPVTGLIVSLYNTGWADFSLGSRLFQVTAVSGGQMTFGGQLLAQSSPRRRYYVVDKAVSCRWDSSTNILGRAVTTVGAAGVASFGAVTRYPLLKDVIDINFYYAAPSLARNGIISVDLTMTRNSQTVTLHKQIHVQNVP